MLPSKKRRENIRYKQFKDQHQYMTYICIMGKIYLGMLREAAMSETYTDS